MDNKLKTVDAETLLSTPMSKTMFIVDEPYFAGRQCHQRCQQDRQKLADAVAGAAGGAGNFLFGGCLHCNAMCSI
ncbi:MAG: hypothetical protein ACLRR6_07765 [Oscillospiraceae bacterium]